MEKQIVDGVANYTNLFIEDNIIFNLLVREDGSVSLYGTAQGNHNHIVVFDSLDNKPPNEPVKELLQKMADCRDGINELLKMAGFESNCKGIWFNKPCPNDAKAIRGREYCDECWNAGEDLIRDKELELPTMEENLDEHWNPHHDERDSDEPPEPDDSAGGFEYPHLSDDDF